MTKLALVASLATLLGSTAIAQAQSYSAPAGEPSVTEPGGTEGRDGRANVLEGIRDGEAVGVPPRATEEYIGERRLRRREDRRLENED